MRKVRFEVILLVIGVLLVVVSMVGRNMYSTRQDYAQLQQLLTDTSNHYETIITDQGQAINIQGQKIATLDNAIAAGLIREDELKEKGIKQVDAIVRLKRQVEILELDVPLQDPDLVTITKTDTVCPEGTFLRVPANFLWSDDWMRLAGTITGPSIRVDQLVVRTEPTILLGYQKTGFFKPLKPVVTVEDKNPHVSNVTIENVVIQKKPPIYKSPWWHRGEGAAAVFLMLFLSNK